MTVKKIKPVLIILDRNKERCLRQESALDRAIADKGVEALGASNYGVGYIGRSGVPEAKLPCIEVGHRFFFPPQADTELSYEDLCVFLDMLTAKGVLRFKALPA